MNLSARAKKAVEILQNGGYFRKALESGFHGGEKFKMRLRHADGSIAKGFGFQTFYELQDAQLLISRECARSSVWPEEYELKK